jgi:hypothetical protein
MPKENYCDQVEYIALQFPECRSLQDQYISYARKLYSVSKTDSSHTSCLFVADIYGESFGKLMSCEVRHTVISRPVSPAKSAVLKMVSARSNDKTAEGAIVNTCRSPSRLRKPNGQPSWSHCCSV